jgi:hypothetical protein
LQAKYKYEFTHTACERITRTLVGLLIRAIF